MTLSSDLTHRLALVFIILLVLVSFATHYDATAPDLYASWNAGKAWSAGDLDAIYPHNTGQFDLLSPPSWYIWAREAQYGDAVYPFIYPPIWAVISSIATKFISYSTFSLIMSAINPLLLTLCVYLAGRIVGLKDNMTLSVLIGLIILFCTWVGQLALQQNQPQITVAALTLLAIERAQAKHNISAGAALALAASIKLYPALFIIFFIASGHKRVVLPFVGFGAALGGASVALAGWPLHALFLDQVKTIAQTVLVTPFSFSLDPMIGQFFFSENLPQKMRPDWAYSGDPNESAILGHSFFEKPALWKAINTGGLLLLIAGSVLAFRLARRAPHAPTAMGWMWAAVMCTYGLISPLSWSYHYIAVVAFAPYLILGLGSRLGILAIGVVFVPLCLPAAQPITTLAGTGYALQWVGTLTMLIYCVLLWGIAVHAMRSMRRTSHAEVENIR